MALVGAKLSDQKARSFLAPGDEIQGIISGTWKETDTGAGVAFLVGGLVLAGMVSREGEGGWLIVTNWAILVIGASKVTGRPGTLLFTLPRDMPLPLYGRRNNRIAVGPNLSLVVRKKDLELAARLAEAMPPHGQSGAFPGHSAFDQMYPAPPGMGAPGGFPPPPPPGGPPPPPPGYGR